MMPNKPVSWVETLTTPEVVPENGRFKIYVPRSGYVCFFPVNDKGQLKKPRKRDWGKHTIDIHHRRQEEVGFQPPPGIFEAAWNQAYAVWQNEKRRGGVQGKLFFMARL
jgi:hypothetical protein